MLEQTEDSGRATDAISVRLAETQEEIIAAQKLRYKVFYEECGAIPTNSTALEKRDFDKYDDMADHLIAVDPLRGNGPERIVGTYRMIRQERIPSGQNFYTSGEFDITPILKTGGNLLELGRSCIHPDYRSRAMLQRIWQGISDYIFQYNIDIMFGCASFQGTDVDAIQKELSYLYHFHKAPADFCPNGLPSRCVDMNFFPKEYIEPQAKEIFQRLPSLIKGYLRTGSMIGNGAYIDRQFNTIDVCVVVNVHSLSEKYLKHYKKDSSMPMHKAVSPEKIES